MHSHIPPERIVCAGCKKGWSIDTCHDSYMDQKTRVFNLKEYIGKTLGSVKKAYGTRRDALYIMQRDPLIRNDRFIDLSPKYPDTKVDCEKNIKKNDLGWADYRDGIDDNYIIQPGDEGYFNVLEYYHIDCFKRQRNKSQLDEYKSIFERAKLHIYIIMQVKNQYSDNIVYSPWYKFYTKEIGIILIGWRKQVINIDWSETGRGFLHLFENEKVTKSHNYIHAYGVEKAAEYLNRIREYLTIHEARV